MDLTVLNYYSSIVGATCDDEPIDAAVGGGQREGNPLSTCASTAYLLPNYE